MRVKPPFNNKNIGGLPYTNEPPIQRKSGNAVISLLIFFLVYFLTVSLSGYIYFNFIKKQSVTEGLQAVRQSTIKFDHTVTDQREKPGSNQPKFSPLNPFFIEQDFPKSKTPRKHLQSSRLSNSGQVFTWRDEHGNIHSSNIEVPQGKRVNNLQIQKEVKTWEKETPIQVSGNRLLIPIILGHNGRKVQTTILIDTGCSHTALNKRQLSRVRGDYHGKSTSTVADGRKVYGEKRRLDYIQVGPFKERNFVVTSQRIAGSDNTGLLGMDFLKKHPFTIDSKRKVIVWQ
jgi:predicted aspartyl protease